MGAKEVPKGIARSDPLNSGPEKDVPSGNTAFVVLNVFLPDHHNPAI